MNISDLIKKSLHYYDSQNNKYKKYFVNTTVKIINDEITIYDKHDKQILHKYCEVLGVFDFQTKVWFWGWLLPYLNLEQTVLTRQLLEYGLKLEPNTNTIEHFYIKSQLINSRFLIEDNIELDINISLASYLLKDNHLFIYEHKLYLDKKKTKYQLVYYIIK